MSCNPGAIEICICDGDVAIKCIYLQTNGDIVALKLYKSVCLLLREVRERPGINNRQGVCFIWI